MALNPKEIYDQLQAHFGEAILTFEEDAQVIVIDPTKTKEIGLVLRDTGQFKFDFLMCLSGVDYADGNLGVVYHLYSMMHNHKVTLKVKVPKDNPKVQTVEKVWRTADWHEREAYDLIGVVFEGHRDLRRILCPYDWEGHPLQKDYKQPEFYQGIKVPY